MKSIDRVPRSGSIKHVRIGGLIANRWPVVCGVLLVVALAGLLWWSPREPRQRPEPVYDGQPLSYWLTNLLSDAPAVGLHGHYYHPSPGSDTNAVPFLIKALKQDSWFGAAIYRKQVWRKLPSAIQKHLPQPADSPRMRTTAVFFLSQNGPMAMPAVAALIRASKEDDDAAVRRSAAWALRWGKGNSNVVTALTGALKDRNAKARSCAVYGLGRIGQGNQAVVAALTEALEDKDRDVHIHAVLALWDLGELKRDGNVVAALTEALQDGDQYIREAATSALLDVDPEAAAKAGVKKPSP